jgi:hypothetical protein
MTAECPLILARLHVSLLGCITVPKPVFMGQSIPLKQVAEEGFLYTDDRS